MDILFKIFLIIKTVSNFHTAFLDKLGFLHEKTLYKIRNRKMNFVARGGTEDMAEIVVVTSGYEYKLESIKLPKSPVIVDLGGHIGTFSIYIARMLKDNCKIYTYEPDKDNYKILKQNIALNKIKSVYPKNIAISDYIGKGHLKIEKMNTDAYHLDLSKGKTLNCSVSTLRKELSTHKVQKIDLLKIDIEGGEYKIFLDKSSLDYIRKSVHYIFIEYHDIDSQYNYSRIKKIIEENFRILHRRANILTLENLFWKGDL